MGAVRATPHLAPGPRRARPGPEAAEAGQEADRQTADVAQCRACSNHPPPPCRSVMVADSVGVGRREGADRAGWGPVVRIDCTQSLCDCNAEAEGRQAKGELEELTRGPGRRCTRRLSRYPSTLRQCMMTYIQLRGLGDAAASRCVAGRIECINCYDRG